MNNNSDIKRNEGWKRIRKNGGNMNPYICITISQIHVYDKEKLSTYLISYWEVSRRIAIVWLKGNRMFSFMK